jgi:hypothetical protein
MAAVVAAILAAFLAGTVALFREHRLQQRRLLVAARVSYATFGAAAKAIKTSLEVNRWALLNAVPGDVSFSNAWETCKGDLAGHLTWREWRQVEEAVSYYLVIKTMKQDDPPQSCRPVLEATRDRLEKGRKALYPYGVQRLSVWQLLRRRLGGTNRAEPALE